MRIAVGRFWTESSSFSPLLASRAMFEAGALLEGDAVLAFARGTRTELGGFLQGLDEAGVEAVPLLAAQASCAGPVEGPLWDEIQRRMVDLLQAAPPVDGVLVSLHGATVAENDDDCCGTLTAALRAVVGPETPIAVTLDLHGNPTDLLVRSADALIAYKTYPHHDFVERGRQAAEIVLAAARSETKPVTERVTIPMSLGSLPLLKELIATGVGHEHEDGVLCCSVMPTHSYLDVAEFHHLSAVVVTDNDRPLARRIAASLLRSAWEGRDRAVDEVRPRVPSEEFLATLRSLPSGTVVAADPQDAVTAGFPGDCPELLRLLLADGNETSCQILTDPGFAERAFALGVGQTIRGPLGGTWGGDLYDPVEVTATIRLLSDGRLQQSREPLPGHLEISNRSMGRTAVVEIENRIAVVVTSVPVMSTEPTVYRSVGIEPYEYRLVVAKSVNQQRFHYTDTAGFIDFGGLGWGRAASSYTWQKRQPDDSFPSRSITDSEIDELLA
jgi:microcystin degradation protein MlrC